MLLCKDGWIERQTERHAGVWGETACLSLALLLVSGNLPPFMGLNVVVSDCGGEKRSTAVWLTFELLSILCFSSPKLLDYS